MKTTSAFRGFANSRFYDLHLLRLLDTHISKQQFVEYVRNHFEPKPAADADVESGAEHLRQYVFQIQWTRAVDSFQRYVVDVLRDVLMAKPELMSSSDSKLTFEEVLKAPDLATLARSMIDKTLRPLVGLKQLESWFKKRGIPLVMTDDERKVLGEAIATRNIIVHNGAIVNQQYQDEALWRGFHEGDLRGIGFDELFLVEMLVKTVATNTDAAIVEKFDVGDDLPPAE